MSFRDKRYGVNTFGERVGHQDTMRSFSDIRIAMIFALDELRRSDRLITNTYVYDVDKPGYMIAVASRRPSLHVTKLKKPRRAW